MEMHRRLQSCFPPILCWNRTLVEPPPRGPSLNNEYLPDEIVVEILARLPAKYVVRCRSVCRRWKGLTSSPEFMELHRRNKFETSFLVQRYLHRTGRYKPLCMVDEESVSGATKRGTRVCKINLDSVRPVELVIPADESVRLETSCCGILVFRELFRSASNGGSQQSFILLNPTTQQKVRFVGPQLSAIYGIFFTPSVQHQYCLLLGTTYPDLDGRLRYKIVALQASETSTPSTRRHKCCSWREVVDDAHDGDPISYQPRLGTCPVIVDDHVLYWMVGCGFATSSHISLSPGKRLFDVCCAKSIMSFNTRTEKFNFIPHPGGTLNSWCEKDPWKHSSHDGLHLVPKTDSFGGILYLCENYKLEPVVINIWILKQLDEEKNIGLWSRWHTVNMDTISYSPPYYGIQPRPVAILGGEVGEQNLYLQWKFCGQFALNIKTGKVERFERFRPRRDKYLAIMHAHHPTLVPLPNGLPFEIWMSN